MLGPKRVAQAELQWVEEVKVAPYMGGKKMGPNSVFKALYLCSWVKIQKSLRCPIVESRKWALAKIWIISAYRFGL